MAEQRLLQVLLVEDDSSIARFVAMALEDDPVCLTIATTLGEARRQLQEHRFEVLLFDLMLPDGSGLDLLREWHQPLRAAGTRSVAFSASLSGAQGAELAQLGVHESLPKPVSMDSLRRAVGKVGPMAVELDASTQGHAGAPADPHADAVREFFGGDPGLYSVYRMQCLAQFRADLAAGDRLVASDRWGELRHLAHSLKSVLRMLGDPMGSAVARGLEDAAERADAAASASGWRRLRGHLQPEPPQAD